MDAGIRTPGIHPRGRPKMKSCKALLPGRLSAAGKSWHGCISIFAKYILYFWHADTSLRTVSGTLGPVNTGLGNMEICISR